MATLTSSPQVEENGVEIHIMMEGVEEGCEECTEQFRSLSEAEQAQEAREYLEYQEDDDE